MSDFQLVYECTMPLRWGDMDAFGHVNNTSFFRYMEQARIEWFEQIAPPGTSLEGTGPVIVNARMTFLQQLHYPGQILCRTFAGQVGRSSFETHFELRRVDKPDALVAEGGAKVVWIDYAAGRSLPLPDRLRTLLGAAG